MFKSTFLLFAVALCATANAAVLVSAPNVLITQIDTNKAQKSLLNEQKEFELSAGVHSISYRYDRLFEVSSDDHEFVRSKPMVAVVTVASSDKKIELKPTKNPAKLDAAKDFAQNASVDIFVDGRLVKTTTAKSSSTSIVSALSNMVSEITENLSNNTDSTEQLTAREELIKSFDLLWSQSNSVERDYMRSVMSNR